MSRKSMSGFIDYYGCRAISPEASLESLVTILVRGNIEPPPIDSFEFYSAFFNYCFKLLILSELRPRKLDTYRLVCFSAPNEPRCKGLRVVTRAKTEDSLGEAVKLFRPPGTLAY